MALSGYPQIVGLLNNGDVLCEMLFRTTPDASEVFNRITSTCPQSGEENGFVVVPRKYYNFINGLRYFEESWALLDNVDASEFFVFTHVIVEYVHLLGFFEIGKYRSQNGLAWLGF
ncbi:hypothetical protein ACFE04_013397 [Oxalis oulophora]